MNGKSGLDHIALKLLGVAFACWAGVLVWAANMVVGEIRDISEQVSAGILPRAEERIDALEADYRQHVRWAEAEEQSLQDRMTRMEIEIARLEKHGK